MTTLLDTPGSDTQDSSRSTGRVVRPTVVATASFAATTFAFLQIGFPAGGAPIPGTPPQPVPLPADVAAAIAATLPEGMSVPVPMLTDLPADAMRPLLQWPLGCYVVAFILAALVAGRFAAQLGPRSLAPALGAFATVSALGSLAHTDNLLLLARTMQGLSAGVVAAAALAALLRVAGATRLHLAIAGWWTTAAVATAAGPSMGAMVFGHWHWSVSEVLLSHVPILLAPAVAMWWALPRGACVMTAPRPTAVQLPAMAVAVVAALSTIAWPSTHITPIAVLATVGILAVLGVLWAIRAPSDSRTR